MDTNQLVELSQRFILPEPIFLPMQDEVEGYLCTVANNVYSNHKQRGMRTYEECKRDVMNVLLEFAAATLPDIIKNPAEYRSTVPYTLAYDNLCLRYGASIDCKRMNWWGSKQLLLSNVKKFDTYRKHIGLIDVAAFGNYRVVKGGYEVTFDALVDAKSLFNDWYGRPIKVPEKNIYNGWLFNLSKAEANGKAVYRRDDE